MKAFHKITASFLLACMAPLSLVGCSRPVEETQTGIIISPDVEYSDAALERAENVIYGLLLHYTEKTVKPDLPEATIEKLRRISGEVCSVIATVPLAEEKFLELLRIFEDSGDEVISELISDGECRDKLLELYSEICAAVGHDYVGRVLYRILEYSLDYRYEKRMNEYQKYGFLYLLEEAKSAAEDKAVLVREIGEDNFLEFIRGAISVAGLWLGGGFDFEKSAKFSDEEILVFLSKIDFSLELSDEAWQVLLSRGLPFVFAGDGLGFFDTSLKNGDIDKLSCVMNAITRFISSVQKSLTTDDIALLRRGEREKLAESVFSRFSDDDWADFAVATSTDFAREDYERICLEKYGSEYEVYASSISPITLSELREAVLRENFYESLERYVGGISPAFSYGMRQ